VRRWIRYVAVFAAGMLAGVVGVYTAWFLRFPYGPERVTLTCLSPDDAVRVSVVERPSLLDRNFELRLEHFGQGPGKAAVVFVSPDEGRPEGSERIVWSADGSRFLLLGRHFYAKAAAPRLGADRSEVAYLMYDLPTGRLWCNAEQQPSHPPFTWDDVRSVQWREESLGSALTGGRKPERPAACSPS